MSQKYLGAKKSKQEDDLEKDDKDPKEDPTDYPIDKDDDDDEEESFKDDADEEEEDKEEDKEEEEEEHLALADSVPPPHILRAESPSTYHPLPLPPHIVIPRTIASMAMIRAAVPFTYILVPRLGILPSETPPSGSPLLLPIPLSASSPPLVLPSTDCRVDAPEVMLPPHKRLCITLGLRYKVRDCSSAPTGRLTRGFRVDYGFVGTLCYE
nr:hypothetical protein [Tanacetum cinerariifolium]